MSEISNKTLATLLIAAIVISLGGTVISLNRMGQRVSLVGSPTGRAQSDTGSAQVSVQESISIILQTGNDSINFGTGFINGSTASCVNNADYVNGGVNLTTVGTGSNMNNCFTTATGYTTTALGANYDTHHFQLENDGTVNVSVAINGPAAEELLNSVSNNGREFSWRGQVYSTTAGFRGTEQNACSSGGALVTTWTNFSRNSTLCDDMQWQNDRDQIRIDVKLRFPGNQDQGLYSDNAITFYAVKA